MTDRKSAVKERRTFSSWFHNVFLYHYLWPTIGVLALLILVFVFVRDSLNKIEPDFTVVVGSIDIWREEDMQPIMSVIKDEVGDANGDGKVDVRIEIYTATLDKTDEYGQQNLEALDMAFIGDPNKILFIFDEELSLRYDPDYFEKLSDYGINSENDPFYQVNELPAFKRMLVVDTPYFMCLKGWNVKEKDNPRYINNYDLAVSVMKRLIEEN